MALDFSSLSAALPNNSVPSVSQSLPVPVSGGLVAELQNKFSNNKQAETQQMLAVLKACATVLASAGLPESPTAIFAASMSSLERLEVQTSPEAGALARFFYCQRTEQSKFALLTAVIQLYDLIQAYQYSARPPTLQQLPAWPQTYGICSLVHTPATFLHVSSVCGEDLL